MFPKALRRILSGAKTVLHVEYDELVGARQFAANPPFFARTFGVRDTFFVYAMYSGRIFA